MKGNRDLIGQHLQLKNIIIGNRGSGGVPVNQEAPPCDSPPRDRRKGILACSHQLLNPRVNPRVTCWVIYHHGLVEIHDFPGDGIEVVPPQHQIFTLAFGKIECSFGFGGLPLIIDQKKNHPIETGNPNDCFEKPRKRFFLVDQTQIVEGLGKMMELSKELKFPSELKIFSQDNDKRKNLVKAGKPDRNGIARCA